MALIFDLFDLIFDLKIVLLEQIGLVAWAGRIVLADQNVCCGSDRSCGRDRSDRSLASDHSLGADRSRGQGNQIVPRGADRSCRADHFFFNPSFL